MAIEVKLPELGEGIESGDVLEVLVQEGDEIQKDQGILEIETDKATVEVPSTAAGRVSKVHVSAGETVNVGAALITVEAESEAEQDEGEEPEPPKKEAAAKQEKPKPAAKAKTEAEEPPDEEVEHEEAAEAGVEEEADEPEEEAEPEEAEPVAEKPAAKPRKTAAAEQPARRAEPAKTPQKQRTPAPAEPESDGGADALPAGPAVRRFAREVGVDLRRVTGSGPAGRITREDVLEVVRQANQEATRGAASASTAAGKSEPARSKAAAPATPPGEATSDAWGPVRVERMSKMRKTIAKKMHESWSTVPRVTNVDDADVTELEKFRQSSKADYADRGIKLTSMPFVIKAVAMALKHHPLINAAIDMESGQIIYKEYVNIGIAVDSERGLVVPSLRNVDRQSIPEIASNLAELAENVRSNNFAIDDLRGSTFTISNLGAIGGSYSTPIVNTPEVAILLIGRSRKMPMVVGDDQIAIRLMMPLSLSYDHRLVDGATAARFLNDVIGYLKAPSRLLLAP